MLFELTILKMYGTACRNTVCCKESFFIQMSLSFPLEAATSILNPAIRPLQQDVYKFGGLKGSTHS
jgi:hypothetical protein